jgi:putative ABC transport system ATP-binding protein
VISICESRQQFEITLTPALSRRTGRGSHKEVSVSDVPVVQGVQLTKEFYRGQTKVVALDSVDVTVERGQFVALMGPSGSGKSTLLHLAAGMDKPTSGRLLVLGEEPAMMSEREIARWRNNHIGFVFQAFNLIPVLSALENVELPLKLTKLSAAKRRENATTALNLVGLGDRLDHLPKQLSGGQEQRVAIARAVVTDPDLILADEPTGNLDAASARDVLTMLTRLNTEFGKTIVMVTHDPHAAAVAKTIYHLDKGKLVSPEVNPLAT